MLVSVTKVIGRVHKVLNERGAPLTREAIHATGAAVAATTDSGTELVLNGVDYDNTTSDGQMVRRLQDLVSNVRPGLGLYDYRVKQTEPVSLVGLAL